MAEKPTLTELRDATGIAQSYASMILSGARPTPPRALAIQIYRKLGWQHPSIAHLTDEQMAASEMIDPWVPPAERIQTGQAA